MIKRALIISILMILLTGCTKTMPLDYNQPKDYKYVLDSYLPDGYEINSEWKKDYLNSSSNKGRTQTRKYKVYWANYADKNDRLKTEEADEAVCMDSMYIEANGGNDYRDTAMSDSVRAALEDNVCRLIDKEVKTAYYKYGTQVINVDFKVSDEDILANTFNINLANMSWEDVQKLNGVISCKNVYTSSTQYSEEEITEAMEEYKSIIEEASGIEFTYTIEKN